MTKNRRFFYIVIVLTVIFFSFNTDLGERQEGGFFSDGGAYFPIIVSLAEDFDLLYTRQDLTRVLEKFANGPVGLFLKNVKQNNSERLYYAKSFIYPLAAAPFYKLFGLHGILLFNGLMIVLSLFMSYKMLAAFHQEHHSFYFSLIFILATVIPAYIWWTQADLFNFFTMLCGLFFFFYPFKKSWPQYLSPFFFSLASFSKISNFIAIGFIFLIPLFKKEFKKFILISLIFISFMTLFAAFNYWQTGEINFMGGNRRPFQGPFPYEKPEYTFASANPNLPQMSADTYWERFYVSPKMVLLNGFYYFFGRFTGMFIYFFPAFFIFVLFFWQKKTKEDYFLLAAILSSILFFITIVSDNYFGGSGSVGNRYFLSIYPLFLFLGLKNRSFKFYYIGLIVAVIFLSPLYINSFYYSANARLTAIYSPARFFPVEKTQYQCLPSNENPRAFGRIIHIGNEKYWLFFLNDNFYQIENDHFWTYGKNTIELIIATSRKVKDFVIHLENINKNNKVFLQLEHLKKRVKLTPLLKHTVEFKNIEGLKVKGRYIYVMKVKSSQSDSPFSNDPGNNDRRILGVKVLIEPKY